MTYQVLALKWRPQVFEDVAGQDAITQTLANAIQQDRIAHAFLFSGVRGVGKTSTARILAKALNCANGPGPTVRPCGECPSCKEITSSRSLDVLEVDGASHTKVEEFRELLDASRYAPARDRFKIYIIDEVHMLSMHSFNALLKTLEEPPPHIKFIFATTEYHKIPDTIVSRCQQYEFRTIPGGEIAAQLRRIAEAENIEVSDYAVSQIARAAEGSLRDAISALDQVLAATGPKIEERDVTELLGLIDRDVIGGAARAIVECDSKAILSIVDKLVRSGRDLQSFARGLMGFIRDILVVQVAPDSPELVDSTTDREELTELASRLSEEDLIRNLDVLTQVESALRWSPEPRFHLEVALLKLSQLRRLASFEDLLARFKELDTGGDRGTEGGGSSSEGSGDIRATRAVARPDPQSTAGGEHVSPKNVSRPANVMASVAEGLENPSVLTSEEILNEVLERLRSERPKLAALVSRHDGASLKGDCLQIAFVDAQPFLREQIEHEDVRLALEREASAVAGRSLRVEFRLSEAAKATVPVPEIESSGDDLFERALKDPMVRGFVATFRGKVEEVLSLNGGSATETGSAGSEGFVKR